MTNQHNDIAAHVCRAVAELPDRNSPADWPEAMLVTHDELQTIVTEALSSAGRVQQAKPVPADILKYAKSMQKQGYTGPLMWASKIIDWVIERGAAPAERAPAPAAAEQTNDVIEAICARIKAADDAAAEGGYMLDSDDCISVIRGTWKGPLLNDQPAAPTAQEAAPAPAAVKTCDTPRYCSSVQRCTSDDERRAAPTAKACEWVEEDAFEMPGTYRTACGHLFAFTDGGLAENEAKFCQYCGGHITAPTAREASPAAPAAQAGQERDAWSTFRKCEHCGCETNAKMRACCRAGWLDDRVASEGRAALASPPAGAE